MEYMNAEAASIFLLENNGNELVCVECAGPVDITGLRLSAGQGIVGEAVMSRSCQMIRDVLSDEHFAKTVDMGSGFQTRSILCMPLVVNDECIGALELLNKRNDDLFDEQDRYLQADSQYRSRILGRRYHPRVTDTRRHRSRWSFRQ